MKAKYIPNVLSVIRIILVFVFVAVFFMYPDNRDIALIVFITCQKQIYSGLTQGAVKG